MTNEKFLFFEIAGRAFCGSCCLFGIWYFILTSFSPVKHYLCVWLLVLQFMYYSLTLIALLFDFPKLAGLSRLLFSINFSMSCVITYVTISSSQGWDEFLGLGNFSLHVVPNVFNFFELVFSVDDNNILSGYHLLLWDIVVPVLVMLVYYCLFFVKDIYEIQFQVDLATTIVIGLLSGTFVALKKKWPSMLVLWKRQERS